MNDRMTNDELMLSEDFDVIRWYIMPLIPKPWHRNVGALQELGKMRGFSSESRHRPSVARDALAGGTSKVEKGEIRINPPLPAVGRIFFRGARNFKHPSNQRTISLKSNDKWRPLRAKAQCPMSKVQGMTKSQIPNCVRALGFGFSLSLGHWTLEIIRRWTGLLWSMPALYGRRDAHHYVLHHFAPFCGLFGTIFTRFRLGMARRGRLW